MNDQLRAAPKLSRLRELRNRVNAEQWLEQADARERQPPHRSIYPDELELSSTASLIDRWWFRILVVLAIALLLGSLYVLSCGANPFGRCEL